MGLGTRGQLGCPLPTSATRACYPRSCSGPSCPGAFPIPSWNSANAIRSSTCRAPGQGGLSGPGPGVICVPWQSRDVLGAAGGTSDSTQQVFCHAPQRDFPAVRAASPLFNSPTRWISVWFPPVPLPLLAHHSKASLPKGALPSVTAGAGQDPYPRVRLSPHPRERQGDTADVCGCLPRGRREAQSHPNPSKPPLSEEAGA